MNQWSLRTEILTITHRWPIIVVFILAGSLIGWGVAQIYPSPYQASSEFYVGIDVYRWAKDQNVLQFTGGVSFNYPDDYKNWQMANLNVIMLTDDVRKEVLRRLRERDSYWLDVSREQLGDMMEVYWRNAGKWRIVINNQQPQRAIQAVEIWQDVGIELIQTATFHSRNVMLLDIQLQSIAAQQTQTQLELAAQQELIQEIERLQTEIAQLSANQAVPQALHSQLQALVAASAKDTPGWNVLLNYLPAAGSQPAAYQVWVTSVHAFLQEELKLSQLALESLGTEWDQTVESFTHASQSTRGVSPTLQVEKISESISPPVRIRPTSTLALIGGLLGLIAWALYWSGWLALRARR
jgi:hypothetical protein